MPRGFTSTSEKNYPDLGGDESSVWNFCARFDFLRRHLVWKPKMALRNVGCFLRLSCDYRLNYNPLSPINIFYYVDSVLIATNPHVCVCILLP